MAFVFYMFEWVFSFDINNSKILKTSALQIILSVFKVRKFYNEESISLYKKGSFSINTIMILK